MKKLSLIFVFIMVVSLLAGGEAAMATQKLVYYGISEWVGGGIGPEYKTAYEDLAKAFEQENPGFELELQHDPWGIWVTKLPTLLASGDAPDVFMVNNPEFPVFANGGYLLDLGEKLDKEYFNKFFQGVLSMYVHKGKNMGMPFTTDCRVLWYNKEVFEAAGLDPDKPPVTWDELKEYAKKCTIKMDEGNVYGYGMDLALQEFPAQSLFCATDASIIDPETLKGNTNTPEFKGYLELLRDMKPYYELDFNAIDHQKASTLFAQKKVAMIIAGFWPWGINEGLKDETFYSLAFVPKMNSSAPDGSFGGGFAICVSSKTKSPDAAVKLAQLITSPEFNARLMSDIPATEDGMKKSKFAEDPKYDMFLKQIKYARQGQSIKTEYYAEIDMAVWETVSAVINGELSVEQGAAKLEEKINQITQ